MIRHFYTALYLALLVHCSSDANRRDFFNIPVKRKDLLFPISLEHSPNLTDSSFQTLSKDDEEEEEYDVSTDDSASFEPTIQSFDEYKLSKAVDEEPEDQPGFERVPEVTIEELGRDLDVPLSITTNSISIFEEDILDPPGRKERVHFYNIQSASTIRRTVHPKKLRSSLDEPSLLSLRKAPPMSDSSKSTSPSEELSEDDVRRKVVQDMTLPKSSPIRVESKSRIDRGSKICSVWAK